MPIPPRMPGANAVTWPAFWAVLVASVFVSLPDPYTTWTTGTAWRNLACIVLAVGAMFTVMLGVRVAMPRNPAGELLRWQVLVMFVAGAVVRALMLAALLPTIGAGEARPVYRIVSSLLIMVPVLVIVTGVVDLLRTSAARRAQLLADGEALSAQADEARARTAALHDDAIGRVRALLLGRLAALRDTGAAGLDAHLRRDVEQVIRPMSHRMAAEDAISRIAMPPPRRARIAWREVWPSASLGRPFRPVLIASIAVVASINPLASSGSGAWGTLGYAAVEWVAVYAVFVLMDRRASRVMRHLDTRARTLVLVAGTIASVAVAGLLLGGAITVTGGALAWRVPIAMVTLGPLVVWALALEQGFRLQVAAADADLVSANARLRASAALAASTLWHEERRLARALHGPVQAAVIAASMRIEAGDDAGAEARLLEAVGHLDPHAPDDWRVGEALAEVATAWEGVCEVQPDLGPGVEERLEANAACAEAFIDICTEACSNAVRHGGATRVVVQARCDDDRLMVVVRDDGAPVKADAPAGLGTALLDDVSLHWERTRQGDATVVRVALPLGA